MSTRRGFLVGALVVAGMVLTACGYLPNIEAPITTSQPGLTETIPGNVTVETETPFVAVTPTVESQVEGVSTIEEVQERIDNFFSGKEDYSFTGPNKDYLFADNVQVLPVSYFSVWKMEPPAVDSCQQQGIYLGSYIVEKDKSIISVFGTQDPKNEQPMIEILLSGFSEKPDTLPLNFVVDYGIVNDRRPSWSQNARETASCVEILKYYLEKKMKLYRGVLFANKILLRLLAK